MVQLGTSGSIAYNQCIDASFIAQKKYINPTPRTAVMFTKKNESTIGSEYFEFELLTFKKQRKMNPKKFKVLTYLGNYVDERLLPKGLYFTSQLS